MDWKILKPLNFTRLASHFEDRLRHASYSESAITAIKCGILSHREFVGGDSLISLHINADLSNDIISEFEAKVFRLMRNSLCATISKHEQPTLEEMEDCFPHRKYSGGRAAVCAKISTSVAPQRISEEIRIGLFKFLWNLALPPDPRGLAALLLLAKGVSDTGLFFPDILSRLNHPRALVVITCPVEGFIHEFVHLLRMGFVLPGRMELINFADPEAGRRLLHARECTNARLALSITAKDGKICDGLSIGELLRYELPIVCLAEDALSVPEHLRLAASLEIHCGSVSADIVRQLISSVYEDASTFDVEGIHFPYVNLDDISLAFRVGNTPAESIALLERLTQMRNQVC